jgi:hypothetical protein
MIPVLVLALAVAPTAAQNRVEIDASLGGAVNRTPPIEETGARWSSLAGSAEMGVTVFLGRQVTDDEGPLSLQPFLQRLSSLHLSASRRGFTGDWSMDGRTTEHRTGTGRTFGASIDGYAGGYIYVEASFAADSDSWHGEYPTQPLAFPTWHGSDSLPMQASFGLRLADVQLVAGWAVTPTRGDTGGFAVDDWRQLYANLRAVVDRRFDLTAQVMAVRGGISLYADGEIFLARNLGVWLRAFGGHTTKDAGSSHWVGGGAGAAWWVSSRVKVGLDYGLSQASYEMPVRDLTEHHFTISTVLRPN